MDQKLQKPWWQQGLVVFSEVTGWIVGPIIAALFLGRHLDNKYGTEPWWFLGLTGVAFIISSAGIVSITFRYLKQIKELEKEKKDKNERNPE